MGFTLAVTATGMVIVFLVLAILIAFVSIMGKIMQRTSKSKEEENVSAPEKSVVFKSTKAPVHDADTEETNTELIAVISAAVAAFSNDDAKSFKIKSIKRVNPRAAWNMAGITDNTQPF